MPPDCLAFQEPDGSGHISPRLFVAAQKKLAAGKGCKIIAKAVSNISKDNDDGAFILELGKGQKSVRARKVLLATGAYANFVPNITNFFPPGKQLGANCIKIGLPGKLILSKRGLPKELYSWEVLFS